MKEIDNKNIKEKCFTEELENGMKVILIPKKEIKKKYVIWATKFGSIDNRFIDARTNTEIFIPDGVAHFLEHKMFEQENGVDSLYVLMALGIDANAYTTNDHTAYLFECTDHFYEGLDELMDYVQHPYFTDKNVEKEKGIIGQEIGMYDDDPGWQLYVNTMDCLYEKNPIKVDIAGTVESIAKINPDVLFKCYNNFYHPSNMVFVAVGAFEPEEMLEEIKAKGINIGYVTLHVGLGTFRPVKVDDVTKHTMHTEHYIMPQETADLINETKKNGGRVISVGTTSCRTLESVATKNGCICADEDDTSIFIYPGYEFKCMDALITNFHLPESTLIMLVSAFAGFDNIMNAYNTAVKEKYRFFSFGDAMFIH